MTEKMQYQRWLDFPLEDPALKEELLSIKDKDEEIFDRFYQELAFGTAGLRGVLSRDQPDEYLYRPQGDPGHGGLSQRKISTQ